jgi:hypothetical protein
MNTERFPFNYLIILILLVGLGACQPPATPTQVPNIDEQIPSTPTHTSTPTPKKTVEVCDPSGNIDPKTTYPISAGNPQWLPGSSDYINSGDFNGDGLADIVFTRYNHSSTDISEVEILLNDGNGGLVAGNDTIFDGSIPTVQNPRWVVIEDFNNDGTSDIFFADTGIDADPWPGYQNTLLLSTPDGKLVDTTSNLPQQSDYSHSAAAADIENDGDLDLFIGNIGNYPPQIWVNDGNGVFSVGAGRLPANQANLELNRYTASLFADLNNDTYPDLVLGVDQSTLDSVVLLNDGAGVFSLGTSPLPPNPGAHPGSSVLSILAADINQDGYQDLIVNGVRDWLRSCQCYFGFFTQALVNNGDGTFRDETESRLPQPGIPIDWLIKLEQYDLDNDGDLDITGRNTGEDPKDNLSYLNDGNGFYRLSYEDYHIPVPNLYTFLDLEDNDELDIFAFVGDFSIGSDDRQYFSQTGYNLVRDVGCRSASRGEVEFATITPPPPTPTISPQLYERGFTLYDDGVVRLVQDHWLDVWNGEVADDSTDVVYAGTKSIKVSVQQYGGFTIGCYPPRDVSSYSWLVLYVNVGDTLYPQISVSANLQGEPLTAMPINLFHYLEDRQLKSGEWNKVVIPLSTIDPDGKDIDELFFRIDVIGTSPLYFDEIRFISAEP